MRITIDKEYELVKDHQSFDLELEIASLKNSSIIKEVRSIRLKADVKNENGINYRIRGQVEVNLLLICSSCTSEFSDTIRFDYDEIFSKEISKEDYDLEFDETNIDISNFLESQQEVNLIENDNIDLLSIIEELIELNLPLRVVCQSDCKGLCPVCGRDRNVSSCDCNTDRIDPRLAVLADLLKDK